MLVKFRVAVPELVTVTDCGALATPTPLEKVRPLTERLAVGVPMGGVVVLEPPQPIRSDKPTTTTKKRLKAAAEKALELIAPPPT
jgi:hypothetical protein